jgi:hypothetical protein
MPVTASWVPEPTPESEAFHVRLWPWPKGRWTTKTTTISHTDRGFAGRASNAAG